MVAPACSTRGVKMADVRAAWAGGWDLILWSCISDQFVRRETVWRVRHEGLWPPAWTGRTVEQAHFAVLCRSFDFCFHNTPPISKTTPLRAVCTALSEGVSSYSHVCLVHACKLSDVLFVSANSRLITFCDHIERRRRSNDYHS